MNTYSTTDSTHRRSSRVLPLLALLLLLAAASAPAGRAAPPAHPDTNGINPCLPPDTLDPELWEALQQAERAAGVAETDSMSRCILPAQLGNEDNASTAVPRGDAGTDGSFALPGAAWRSTVADDPCTDEDESDPPTDIFPETEEMVVRDIFRQFAAVKSSSSTSTAVPAPPEQAWLSMLPEAAALPDVLATPAYSATTTYLPLVSRARSPSTTTTPACPAAVRTQGNNDASVAVRLWPQPSIRARRGDILAYEIRLLNYGQGSASHTEVTLPYEREHFTLISSKLSQEHGDWVSRIDDDSFRVTFGKLKGHTQRNGWVFLRVAGDMPDNTVISMRAKSTWHDGDGDHGTSSNWAPVLIGNGNDSAPWAWLRVSPVVGKRGTTHRFFTDRFIPGERINVWLNTPNGIKRYDKHTYRADEYGRIKVVLTTTGYRRAFYSIALYGTRSRLTAVGNFVVAP